MLTDLTLAELSRPGTARLLAALEEADATYLRAPAGLQEFTLSLMSSDGELALALRRHGQTVQAWVMRLGTECPLYWPGTPLPEDVTDAVAHVLEVMGASPEVALRHPVFARHRWN